METKTHIEVFEQVALHLMKQNERCVSDDCTKDGEVYPCAYRGPRGLSCAVGCLIPDDKYNPNLEGLCAAEMMNKIGGGTAGAFGFKLSPSHFDEAMLIDMLQELQNIHDSYEPFEWPDRLCVIATRFDIPLSDEVEDAMAKNREQYHGD